MRNYIIIFAISLLTACNNDAPSTEIKPPEKEVAVNTENKIVAPADSLPANQQTDSTIHFLFDKDSSSLTAKGFINSARDHIIGYLPVDRKASLSAQLIPLDKDLNIRFTQLIMPDSTMDGPFGQQFKYSLSQKGMYRIIISPNNMADGKSKGEFLIRLAVKTK